jgi:hypothetical protein
VLIISHGHLYLAFPNSHPVLLRLGEGAQSKEVVMHGVPLTRSEVTVVLRGQIARLVARGIDSSVATRVIADEHGVDPVRVAQLLGSTDRKTGRAS